MDLYDKSSFYPADGPWQLIKEMSRGVARIKLDPSHAVMGAEKEREQNKGEKER